jgi:hypothetical protein
MTIARWVTLALVCAASHAAAQAAKAPARPDSAKAPAGGAAATKQAAQGTKTVAPPGVTGAPAPAPQEPRTPVIMREVYSYDSEGRRDPFVTLLTSSDLRPTVADLRLTGILYDENGPNSIATMRDLVTDAQYRVTAGQTLGRMKVALIKRKAVIFSIEAFGINRQDSLVLGDTTKARSR